MCEGHSETLQDHEERINRLKHELHDKEMLIDDMEHRLRNLQERVTMIEFYRRQEK